LETVTRRTTTLASSQSGEEISIPLFPSGVDEFDGVKHRTVAALLSERSVQFVELPLPVRLVLLTGAQSFVFFHGEEDGPRRAGTLDKVGFAALRDATQLLSEVDSRLGGADGSGHL
jgi:hypothetical protein